MFAEEKWKLAHDLHKIGAIRFGNFRLKLHEKNPDAPLSPIYIDLRLLRSFPDVMDLAVSVYKDLSVQFNFELYADVPTAATPIVAILSHISRVPMISPRKDEKKYGVVRPIDGFFESDQRVLLVDDLITQATSKMEAISVLEENGLKVSGVIVLVDRQQGGPIELEEHGYVCRAAFKLSELLEFYLKTKSINEHDYRRTVDYLNH